jgi:hypothetical protein
VHLFESLAAFFLYYAKQVYYEFRPVLRDQAGKVLREAGESALKPEAAELFRPPRRQHEVVPGQAF